MTINRKDTILIAVLMNVGLLTILFITAMSYDDASTTPPETKPMIAKAPIKEAPREYIQLVSSQDLPSDEVDQVLHAYTEQNKTGESKPPETAEPKSDEKYVEITVKRGDSLDRIARANKTTIRTLKKLNDLKTDRLRIGQVLKIPLPQQTVADAAPKTSEPIPSGAVYYEMEKGDNPWKVAKKFHVSYESIVTLNELDDQKAKNLKPGDKIRIK